MAKRIDVAELIDAPEVARILGLSHYNSVTTYLRRYPEMPRPILDFGHGRCRLWKRQEIVAWSDRR
ncbi:MAG: hypothetical protein ACR2KQ_08450 [Actinomycetota bacterium]